MSPARRCFSGLGILLVALTAGPLGATPPGTSPAPPPPAASRPTPEQIHQAAAAVLSQGKYHREPSPVQTWLERLLKALWRRLLPFLQRLVESSAMATGAQVVFYALTAVVTLVALILLARLLLGRRRREPKPELARLTRPARWASPTDLQSQAAALAARGEYGAALRLLQQACLLALDRRGLLVIRTANTNGEYLRQLRPHPEPRALLGTLLALVELYLYAGHPLDEGQYRHGEQSALALLRGGAAGAGGEAE